MCETITEPSTEAFFPVMVVVQATAGRENPRTAIVIAASNVFFIFVPPLEWCYGNCTFIIQYERGGRYSASGTSAFASAGSIPTETRAPSG